MATLLDEEIPSKEVLDLENHHLPAWQFRSRWDLL